MDTGNALERPDECCAHRAPGPVIPRVETDLRGGGGGFERCGDEQRRIGRKG